MKKLLGLSLITLIFLTGCASGCTHACLFGFGPGNATFDSVARHYDTEDRCQFTGKPEGYQLPYYCGAGSRRATITDRYGYTIGYIK